MSPAANLRLLVAATGLLTLSACTTFSKTASSPLANPDLPAARTQLMALNFKDASGWIAYRGAEDSSGEMEEYRLVVIRQQNGQVIYDSIVPLAANLQTHGFEMDLNDPRLQSLARRADQGILLPMEAYFKSEGIDPTVPASSPSAPQADPPSESVNEPIDSPAVSSLPDSSTTSSGLLGIRLQQVKGDQLILQPDSEETLRVGDKLFLRHPPKVIQIPGVDEQVVTRGEVMGWAQVTQVNPDRIIAKRLSGEIPDPVVFEKDPDDNAPR